MKKIYVLPLLFLLLFKHSFCQQVLVFHTIQTDSSGKMVPWYNADPSVAYDHDLNLIWNFWQNIPTSLGTPYYMTDHSYGVVSPANMIGGDQFAMALSSWTLLYQYTGDTAMV